MGEGIPLRDGHRCGFGTIYLARGFFENEANIERGALLSSLIRNARHSTVFKPVTSFEKTGLHVYRPYVDSDGGLLIANKAGLEKWRSKAFVPSDFKRKLLNVSKSVVCERELVTHVKGFGWAIDHSYFIVEHKGWYNTNFESPTRIVWNPLPSHLHHNVTFYIGDTGVASVIIWPCSRDRLQVEYYRNKDKTKHFLVYLGSREQSDMRTRSNMTAVLQYLKKYPRALVDQNTVSQASRSLSFDATHMRNTRYRLFLRDNVTLVSYHNHVYCTTRQGRKGNRRRNLILAFIGFQRLWKKHLYAPDRFFKTKMYESIKELRWDTKMLTVKGYDGHEQSHHRLGSDVRRGDVIKVLDKLCGQAGTNCVVGLKRQDELRIFEAEKAMKDIEKKQKKSEKQ
ncbi:hypothetical protein J6590_016101 [Homalodisca vitripennis]|nr:hypothetical protein J6590_016101 [Homalodisca vitripennis]